MAQYSVGGLDTKRHITSDVRREEVRLFTAYSGNQQKKRST